MISVPPRDLIAMLEALRGEPRVTYPEGSLDYPATERLVTRLRGKATLPFLSPEPDSGNFPDLVLTSQQIVSTNRTHATTYERYERLPGFEIVTAGFEHETGARTYAIRHRVAAGAALPSRGSTREFGGSEAVVIDAELAPDGDVAGTLSVQYMVLPPPRTVRVGGSYPLPSSFTFVSGWVVPRTPGFSASNPRGGRASDGTAVNYVLKTRTPASGIFCDITYSVGQPIAALPEVFNVTSGQSSYVPIGPNTLHNEYELLETSHQSGHDGEQQIAEAMEASVPTSIASHDVLVIDVKQEPKFGPIWERRVTKIQVP